MRVIYYTSAHFLDEALETVQLIKHQAHVHLMIEVSEFSKKATVLNLESIRHFPLIASAKKVLNENDYKLFSQYFDGLASVHFVIQKNKRSFSPLSMLNAIRIFRFMRKLKYDVLHLDNISPRILAMFPLIRRKKLVITLHDPLPHTGEESWKIRVRDKYFVKAAHSFVFFSDYSKKLFQQHHPHISAPCYSIFLQPYNFALHYTNKDNIENGAILFWGRLSAYKGIDILMQAIPKVLEKYPNQHFIIAGKESYDFKLDKSLFTSFQNNITLITSYLDYPEAIRLIQQSKFVVCPYRDATQSGILCNVFAVGKTAVVTNVGSFTEYVTDKVNGLVAEPNVDSLAKKIMEAIDNDYYRELEKNMNLSPVIMNRQQMSLVLMEAYSVSNQPQ